MEEKFKKTKIKKILIYSIFSLVVFVFFPIAIKAASLYFSPSSGKYSVGNSISVGVYVSSANESMNAASGVVSFPKDKLEVSSVSKAGSIFSLWVQEPTFSNTTGRVNFEGIVLNPGFSGSSGKLITINFKVKSLGDANLSISSASVLANDGQGTNILTGSGSAKFSIGEEVKKEEPKTPTVSGVPSAPQIISLTHPDSNSWYAFKDVKFTWNVSKDITGVSLLVGDKENVVPTVTYTTAINSRELKDLDDGVWYFNVRLRNARGWGAVSSFKFQIDTEKPESFDIKQIQLENKKSNASFIFSSSDRTSGISHYEIQINDDIPEIWQDLENNIYETKILNPGKYTLSVKAVDKAGNFLERSLAFEIEGLEPPTITEYSKELQSGETLIIKGKTYANFDVIIWIQKGKSKAKSYNIRSDENGNFIFTKEKLSRGVYSIWAQVKNDSGQKSNASEKINVNVKLGTISNWVINLPVSMVVFIVFVLLAAYFCYRYFTFKKKMRREVFEAKAALHRSFEFIRKDIKREIKLFEAVKTKKELLQEMDKISHKLKKDLDNAEKIVKKEIDDIEKRLK